MSLFEYLAGQGHECHLLCHPGSPLQQKAEKARFRTLPIKMRNESDPRPAPLFRALVRREGYDIVHFHTKRAHALCFWLGRRRFLPRTVVTRRMDYPLARSWYNRYLYSRKTDGVVAISRKIAEVLVQAGVAREKIRVIYSGVDARKFGASPFRHWNDRAPVVGTVAALFQRKGHRFLLEAAARLNQGGMRAEYLFAGEGPERNALQRQAIELGLGSQVSFEGFVSDIAGFLARIDIFALPSLYEGLGVAVLEAMAAGKPIVASEVGGIPELIDHGATGLLVPAGEPEALAKALAGLVREPERAERLGAAARKKVAEEFSIEQMARKNEAFYYELLSHDQG